MSWYLSRLASMGPAEILWRGRMATVQPLDWARFKIGATAPAPRWALFTATSYPVRLHDCGSAMEHVRIFDLEFPVDFDFDWHRDRSEERRVGKECRSRSSP